MNNLVHFLRFACWKTIRLRGWTLVASDKRGGRIVLILPSFDVVEG